MLGDRVMVARYLGHGIVDKVLRVDGVGGQGSGDTLLVGTVLWTKY